MKTELAKTELAKTELDLKLKVDLYKIINGDYNNDLTPDQIELAIKLSFLFNHTIIDNDIVIFEYNSSKLKIKDYYPDDNHEFIISAIYNDDIFKNSLKSFLRDNKIKKIID